jgi:hypothetical protein
MNRQEPEMDTPANSGLVRQSPGNTFGPIGIQRFSFNFCPPNTPNTVGDPRISYSCISDWATLNNITSALWQGRQTDTGGRQQNFLSTWADRDFIRDNIPLGSTLASLSADPTVIPSSYSNIQAALAPAQIRNGPMQSIGEIGHIFDPAQVNNTGGNPSGGTPASYYRPGGGRSLRVGQPEFTFATGSWNQSSLRAIELVDIFSVHSTNSNSMGYPVTYGKININTAPKEILEAIFHGITINSDPAANSASVTTTEASRIAQLIISNRPYNRISDLYRILPNIASGTNFSPVIPTQVGGGTTNLALMDRAREEFFGKFVELTSTQSRAFRVFVIGQALDPRTGRVLSQSFIESSVAWDSAPPNSKPNEAYLQRE